ncbi:protein of unknown function [Mesotoga infera]|uniref:Uncharacterized protein n=1 Tax=Mesotoga infera TaxID=1236046 RepID=A0A7Z7LI80_9BACT|nr:protein of unknown function [Mesotoga infera]
MHPGVFRNDSKISGAGMLQDQNAIKEKLNSFLQRYVEILHCYELNNC